MKTFGLKTIILELCIFAVLLTLYFFNRSGMGIAFVLPVALSVGHLAYCPLIRVGNGRIRMATLTSLSGKIDEPVANIHSIHVKGGRFTNLRFTFTLKDGTERHFSCSRYAYDMSPLRDALLQTGIPLHTEGFSEW